MRIQVKGRNLHVSDDMREHVNRRFGKISKQVSELAELEVELIQGAQPGEPRQPGGRGHAAPQGGHAAGSRRLG